MNEVRAQLARGRQVTPDDFADLTDTPVSVYWGDDGCLVVNPAEPVSDDVRAAIRRRVMSATSREEQLRTDAEAYLDAPEPDLTEIRAQVARLSEIVLGRAEE